MRSEQEPLFLRRPFFVIGSLLLAVLFGFLAYWLYVGLGKTAEFQEKLGELALQISVLVLAGAAVKEFIDWRNTIKTDVTRGKELRAQFLQRLRDIHVKVLFSRDMMRAHLTAKTWSEQSRLLMQLISELEELSEDLQASPKLFNNQKQIITGVEGIISYLGLCRDEYVKHHKVVTRNYDEGTRLVDAIENLNMIWANDFIEGNGTFEEGYTLHLRNAKIPMRKAVFELI